MPTVVSPSCFLGSFIWALTPSHWKYPLKNVLDFVPLTFVLDLHIPPLELHADFQVCVCPSGHLSGTTHTMSKILHLPLAWGVIISPWVSRMWCHNWGIIPPDNSWVQDGSHIFKGQCAGRVPVIFVLKTLGIWCSKGDWEGTSGVTYPGRWGAHKKRSA